MIPPTRDTGHLAYGWMKDPINPRGEFVKNYEEIATITTIILRWEAGDSCQAIRRWLAGTGVRNRSGNINWCNKQIKRIIERYYKELDK